jgi:hypothetical protein
MPQFALDYRRMTPEMRAYFSRFGTPGYETTARSGPAPAPDAAALARREHRLRNGLSRATADGEHAAEALALRRRELELLRLQG